ncbi:hypothetical protein BKI52_01790 [marine bacterium AO1-C]|nr:hypothetical protein BKI52_01790 [marine bacterium AO1-C]
MKNYNLTLIKILVLLWLFLVSVIHNIWAQKKTAFSSGCDQVDSAVHQDQLTNQPKIYKQNIYNHLERLISYRAIVTSVQTIDLWPEAVFATLLKRRSSWLPHNQFVINR